MKSVSLDILMVVDSPKQFSWSPLCGKRDMICFSQMKELETQVTRFLSFVTERASNCQTSEVKGKN